MLRCHCFAHLHGLTLCIIMTTATAADDVPAPPVPPAPPTPTRFVPQHSQCPTVSQPLPPAFYLHDGPCEPKGSRFTMDNFKNQLHDGGGLLGSDAFAGDPTDEALPECHPLPCLVEARWRHEPVTPEFAAPSSCTPATSECSPALGVCFPNADKIGQGPACFDVRFVPACPAPVPTARHTPRRPPVPHLVRVAAAAPESPQPLTRVQHLQKAADHLDAAGCTDEAQHLRERAADMQRHAQQRLQELREQKQRIEKEIQELEQISGLVDQVQIRVSMLELDQQKLKQLGIKFETPEEFQVQLSGTHDQPQFKLLSSTLAAAQLHALRKSGAAKVLAEPTVVTTLGRPGSIRSGGEFPIPLPQTDGTAKLHWENYGVYLEAIPQILDDGRLRLDIRSEFAERDFGNCETVEGFKVPGIRKRQINTQVEMRFDQTLVIGGLSETKQPVMGRPNPILHKTPHQHRLFRQVSDTVSEESSATSLVVFVTAEPLPATASVPGH